MLRRPRGTLLAGSRRRVSREIEKAHSGRDPHPWISLAGRCPWAIDNKRSVAMYLQMGRASVESQAKMLRVLMVGAGSRARRPLLTLAVAVGIALAAAPTLAHHSRAMFDMGKNITYRGVVEEYRWQNPHSHIVVRVGAGAADRSPVGTWTVEASAISVMTSSGWTPRTYKPGDPITVVAHPNMDGSNLVLLFYAIKADGTRLYRAAHRYDGEKE